jgi:NhaP-type Na+/H+ or K+/H+ antiporter
MLPVAVALLGTGRRRDTVALMGWFSPWGLASVVFTLLACLCLVEARQPADALVGVAAWTIPLSVLLHGLTAQPLAAWYARRRSAAGPGAPALAEGVDVPAARVRRGLWPTVPEPLAAAAPEEAGDGR